MSASSAQRAFTPSDGARFQQVFARVEGIEGGLVDDPVDHGGLTSGGVTLRFLVAEGKVDLDHDGFADFDLNHDGDIDGQDLRLLTREDREALFERCLWLRTGFWTLPRTFDCALYDEAVNSGVVASVKLLQRALNATFRTYFGLEPLTVDGGLGPVTRARLQLAFDKNHAPDALAAYRKAAADRYIAIVARDTTQRKYIAGWLKRASELGDV